MTCIAWDGISLAADKRAVNAGLARTTTKIFRVDDFLAGFAGDAGQGLEMLAWARNGFQIRDFPESQRNKDTWATFVIIDTDGVRCYENSPYPVKFEDDIWATGSGRDFALAAMYCGKTSAEAVEIASIFEVNCGNGVDELKL